MKCLHYNSDNKACYWLWEPGGQISRCPYTRSSSPEEKCNGYVFFCTNLHDGMCKKTGRPCAKPALGMCPVELIKKYETNEETK
jgi:hypothetical protein